MLPVIGGSLQCDYHSFHVTTTVAGSHVTCKIMYPPTPNKCNDTRKWAGCLGPFVLWWVPSGGHL